MFKGSILGRGHGWRQGQLGPAQGCDPVSIRLQAAQLGWGGSRDIRWGEEVGTVALW